jgi:hypothetical protein
MPELASETWDEIQRQYAEGAGIVALAGHFNVSRAQIRRRANKFGWVRNGANDGTAAAQKQDRLPGSANASSAEDASISDERTALV